jgi:hypothetical protein
MKVAPPPTPQAWKIYERRPACPSQAFFHGQDQGGQVPVGS